MKQRSAAIDNKTCPKCGETKPVGEFYKAASKHDGLRSECKACTKKYTAGPDVRARRLTYLREWQSSPQHRNYMRVYRQKHRERIREINARSAKKRRCNPETRRKHLEYQRRYQKTPRSLLLHGAATMVMAAIRLGMIEKTPCRICGGPSQAHHHDYTKPLEVTWLCRKHHMENHAVLWSKKPRKIK